MINMKYNAITRKVIRRENFQMPENSVFQGNNSQLPAGTMKKTKSKRNFRMHEFLEQIFRKEYLINREHQMANKKICQWNSDYCLKFKVNSTQNVTIYRVPFSQSTVPHKNNPMLTGLDISEPIILENKVAYEGELLNLWKDLIIPDELKNKGWKMNQIEIDLEKHNLLVKEGTDIKLMLHASKVAYW